MLARLRAGQHDGHCHQAGDVGSFMTRGIPQLLPLAHAKLDGVMVPTESPWAFSYMTSTQSNIISLIVFKILRIK